MTRRFYVMAKDEKYISDMQFNNITETLGRHFKIVDSTKLFGKYGVFFSVETEDMKEIDAFVCLMKDYLPEDTPVVVLECK